MNIMTSYWLWPGGSSYIRQTCSTFDSTDTTRQVGLVEFDVCLTLASYCSKFLIPWFHGLPVVLIVWMDTFYSINNKLNAVFDITMITMLNKCDNTSLTSEQFPIP